MCKQFQTVLSDEEEGERTTQQTGEEPPAGNATVAPHVTSPHAAYHPAAHRAAAQPHRQQRQQDHRGDEQQGERPRVETVRSHGQSPPPAVPGCRRRAQPVNIVRAVRYILRTTPTSQLGVDVVLAAESPFPSR